MDAFRKATLSKYKSNAMKQENEPQVKKLMNEYNRRVIFIKVCPTQSEMDKINMISSMLL